MKLNFIYICLLSFTLIQIKLITSKEIVRCDFEKNDYCKWKPSGKSWSFATSKDELSPAIDGLTAPFRQNGSYLKFSNKSDTNFVTFTSDYLKKLPQSICFTFHYYLFAAEQRPLELYTQTLVENKETLIWKQANSISDKWRKTRLSIQTRGESKLLKFKIFSKFIAFDEFIVEDGNCSYDGLCDFESDFCSWKPVENANDYVWKRSNNNDRYSYLPKVDHTTGTENGYFIYVSDGNRKPGTAQIESPVHDQSFGVHCLSFWFYTSRNYKNALNVWLQDAKNTSSRQQLWTTNKIEDTPNNQWQFAQVSIGTTKPSRILIEEVKQQKGYSDTSAIDDIRLNVGKCHSIATCDFDEDTCAFTANIEDITLRHGFGRVTNLKSMPKKFSPPIDASSTNGLYVYSDFSDIKDKTVNTLTSETLSPTKQACLRFSYFINGIQVTNTSQLNIKLRQNEDRTIQNTIFGDNNYGKDWRNATLNITGQDLSFRVIFEMIGYEKGSIVAIDDIEYTDRNCNEGASTDTSVTLVEDLSCDFENGLCSWTSTKTSKSKSIWKTETPKELNIEIPDFDITTQSKYGKYAYVTDDSLSGSSGILTSKRTLGDGWRCLSFWYWNRGIGSQRFKAAILNVDEEVEQVLFDKIRRNTFGWQHIRSAYFSDKEHEIALYASGYRFITAIDEVKVFKGGCPEASTDFVNCDFESGQCGFVPKDNKDILWKRYAANEVSQYIVFDADFSWSGHFIALDFGNSGNVTGNSQIVSPTMHASEVSCLSFSRYLTAKGSKLNIYALESGSDDPQLVATFATTQNTNRWIRNFAEITLRKKFNVIVEGEYEEANEGLIALDNVQITSGACNGFMQCDFEEECFWRSLDSTSKLDSYEINLDWIRSKGTYLLGKINDHTLNRQQGNVLAMSTDRRSKKKKPREYAAAYKSIPFGSIDRKISVCLQFAHFFEKKHTIYVFYGKDDESLMQLNQITPDSVQQWKVTQIDFEVKGEFYIYFVGQMKTSLPTFIALDDISVSYSKCPKLEDTFQCKSGEKIPISKVCDFKRDCSSNDDEDKCGDCSFDDDFCGYKTSGFELVKEQFVDNFMAELETRKTTTATIQSNWLRNAAKTCSVEFRYRYSTGLSYSADISVDLNIINNQESVNLWKNDLTSNWNSDWHDASFALGAVDKFKITFKTRVKRAWYSIGPATIAIDDIQFKNCSYPLPTSHCGEDKFRCNNRVCIEKSLDVCDFENDCGDNSDELKCDDYKTRCDFENGVCDKWVNNRWTLKSGYKNLKDGPTRDHTTGLRSGLFLIYNNPESTASLEFKDTIYPSNGCFFRLFYNSYSNEALIYLQLVYENGSATTVTSLKQHNQRLFKKASVDLSNPNLGNSFKLKLIPEINNKSGGDFAAIDDLSFTPECFKDETTVTTTEAPPKPSCPNYCILDQKCLNESQVCDFNKDCADGSDEMNCGDCDFEDSFCGWTNEGNEQWLSATGERFKEYKLFPTVDSKGLNSSTFLILQSNTAPTKGEVAILRSKTIGKVSPGCHFQFSYFNNFKRGSMKIQLRGENTSTIVFSAPFTNSTIWHQIALPINPISDRFNIEVIASGEYHKWIDEIVPIGVDDFKLLNCSPTGDEKEQTLDCDFEKDECGWFQLRLNSERLPWIRSNDFAEIHLGYNVSSDHTKNNGYFVYVHKPDGSNGTQAVYMSPIQKPTKKSCFHFWYRMFSRIPISLELSVNPIKGGFHRVMLKRNSQSNSWQEDWVNIESDQQYRIMFRANIEAYSSREMLNKFLIALDDFSLIEGACISKEICDFETNSCEWNSNDWERVIGSKTNPMIVDHSTGTVSGYFMSAKNNAKLTRQLKDTHTFPRQCLSFWFLMKGGNEDILSVTQNNVELWKQTAVDEILETPDIKQIDDGWIYGRVNVSSRSDKTVTFNAKLNSVVSSTILLDDVSLSDSPCPPVGSCDFEKDFCGWRNVNSKGMNGNVWLRNSGKTPSPYSGPNEDNTLKTDEGFYLFVENHGFENETAVIESELLRITPTICLRFYYHMYSTDEDADIGSLNTAYFDEKGGYVIDIGEPIVGVQSNEWLLHKQTFQNLPEKYKLLITAKTGKATTGDIAIDDILVTEGSCEGKPKPRCSSEEFDCKTKETMCIPKLYVCDFTEDCPNGADEKEACTSSCNFENGDLCGWTITNPNLKPAWKISRAGDVKDRTLTRKDHTVNTARGWYAYVNSDKTNKGSAKLDSNIFARSGSECVIDFYFYCALRNCNLRLQKVNENSAQTLLWDPFNAGLFRYGKPQWRLAKAYIGKDENFKLSFSMNDYHGVSDSVAIDDIVFRNCSVPRFGDTDNCDESKQFRCSNGHCIDKQRECDFTDDCMDNSDEDPGDGNCKERVGNCDFERNCTHWRWGGNMRKAKGLSQILYTPRTDHTTRTMNGTYLTLTRFVRWVVGVSERSRIISNVISYESNSCTMRFWYNIAGDPSKDTITVYKRYDNSRKPMTFIKNITVEDVNDFWRRTEVNLFETENKANFEVVIEIDLDSVGSVNIDDISFSSDCVIFDEVFPPVTKKPRSTTPMIPTTTEQPTTPQFTCPFFTYPCKTVKKCYTWQQVCNFLDDCGDNTDEDNCGAKCDFESKCDWFNDYGYSNVRWSVNSGPSMNRKLGTGPESDHTRGTKEGRYLVTNGTENAYFQNRIVYRSPYYRSSGKQCNLQFYYHMLNTKSATLSVTMTRSSIPLWTVTGNKGDQWIRAKIFIGRQVLAFYLSFIASVGKSGEVFDIALDDIELSDCAPDDMNCGADELMCSDNSTCYKVWERCNGVYNCDDKSDELNCKTTTGNCDFNSANWVELCKWKHLERDFEWSTARVSDKKTTGPQTPLSDSDLLPSSNYRSLMSPSLIQVLYLNSTGRDAGDAAAIATPEFAASDDVCHLTYHYYMYGSPNMGPLRVYAQGTKSGNKSLIAEYHGNSGRKWISANHVIESEEPYTVVFEGLVGEPNLSDIAVDEVRFSPNCKEGTIPIVTPQPCSGFLCKNGDCIPDASVRCDQKQDCSDGSDEDGCEYPEPICNRKGHFVCSPNVCIPGIMVCDGFKDCPKGEDESGCTEICDDQHYYCPKENKNCRDFIETCDGSDQCELGYDESLCAVEECPEKYCVNGEQCITGGGVPYCRGCPEDATRRCVRLNATTKFTTPMSTTQESSSVSMIIASTKSPDADHLKSDDRKTNYAAISLGVVVGIVILVIIGAALYSRFRSGSHNFPPMTFSNPVYEVALNDLSTDETQGTSSGAKEEADDSSISVPAMSWRRYH